MVTHTHTHIHSQTETHFVLTFCWLKLFVVCAALHFSLFLAYSENDRKCKRKGSCFSLCVRVLKCCGQPLLKLRTLSWEHQKVQRRLLWWAAARVWMDVFAENSRGKKTPRATSHACASVNKYLCLSARACVCVRDLMVQPWQEQHLLNFFSSWFLPSSSASRNFSHFTKVGHTNSFRSTLVHSVCVCVRVLCKC